jgi:succinyl-diaminopimelate desuccinylase
MIDAVELTRDLVRTDSINPTSTERACADRIGALLEKAGFSTSRFEYAPGHTSLVARRGGGDKPALCFTGHLDTVPLGAAKWSHEPLAGEIDGGKLYGRGSSDMKSGVAAIVAAAIELSRRPAGKAGLELVFTAGEETGCLGAIHLARTAGALGRASAVVVAEPTGNEPLIGHKGAFWLRLRTRGVTAHGSMPERGVNAIYKAARAVMKLEEFRFQAAPDPLLGRPSLNVGTVRGGLNTNSVPDLVELTVDIRTTPEVSHAALQAELARLLGPEVEIEPIVDATSVRTREDDPFVETVVEVLSQVRKARPRTGSAPYFTDASALTGAYGGVPTVILGPGELSLCHQTDEYCETNNISQAVEAYVEIARRWCEP